MNDLGAIPAATDPMVQVMAVSALRVPDDETLHLDAMCERHKRREVHDIAPLCDYAPPVGFAWPDYIDTPRGRDWHISVSPN